MFKMSKNVGVLLVAVLAASLAVSMVAACQTGTPGYWKNHPGAWPSIRTTDSRWGFIQTFPIPADAMSILWMKDGGDARINLQQKVIAASLSILADPDIGWDYDPRYGGATSLPVLVAQANALLTANPRPWTPGSTADESGVRAQGLALASAIDYWLNYFNYY